MFSGAARRLSQLLNLTDETYTVLASCCYLWLHHNVMSNLNDPTPY
jgi:hypothetical protein